MAAHHVTRCWLLTLLVNALLLLRPCLLLAQASPQPGSHGQPPLLPGNPFPRANCVVVQPLASESGALTRFVQYLHTQGYVVDSVDQELFFTVQAHTTLPLPRRPLPLQVHAYFSGLPGTVRLQATYTPVFPRRVRVLSAPRPTAILSAPTRLRSVRYATRLAPARRAAFVELQRLGREAFPGAGLTYANESF